MTRIVVHIEELTLHGFDATSRDAVGDAARAEIARRLETGDLPSSWRQGATIERISTGETRLPAAPGQSGVAIGAAVHQAMVGAQGGRPS